MENTLTCKSCGKRKFSKAFIKGNKETCIKCLYKETIADNNRRISKSEYTKKLPADRVRSKCPLCGVIHIAKAKYVYCVNCKYSTELKTMPWDFI